MVKCLALQLAEQLPGFAPLLEPIVKQYKNDLESLTLVDVFEK